MDGVDWFSMGVAMSGRFGSLYEVRHRLAFRDVYEAHVALDAANRLEELNRVNHDS